MKNYNTYYIKYKHEKSMVEYGESAGYRIGNSEIYLIYVYPAKMNPWKNHKIIAINDDKYYINNLTFNLG